jgi:hypothetical protein
MFANAPRPVVAAFALAFWPVGVSYLVAREFYRRFFEPPR